MGEILPLRPEYLEPDGRPGPYRAYEGGVTFQMYWDPELRRAVPDRRLPPRPQTRRLELLAKSRAGRQMEWRLRIDAGLQWELECLAAAVEISATTLASRAIRHLLEAARSDPEWRDRFT